MDRLQQPVLVLNASYEPINVCAARRAIVLIIKGVAAAEEFGVNHVHSTSRSLEMPSVIRLL
ncbi:MAG: HNH endonuclease, partial [Bryobacterales bacterium]|nr:HNH endonuclease [Bryobacterales bacterium]